MSASSEASYEPELGSAHSTPRTGDEPQLGGGQQVKLSGLEPQLGGRRRVQPDPQLMAMLLGADYERQQAIGRITDGGLGRFYALELVKMIPRRRISSGGRRRLAYTPAQRIAATRALQAFGQDVAVEALVDALGDHVWWLGQYAMEALTAIGSPAVEALIEQMAHRDPVVRRRVADTLGLIGDRRATPALLEAIEDEEAWVRLRVVEALRRLSDTRARDALQRATHDEDAAVARAAIEALNTARNVGRGRNLLHPIRSL